MGPCQGLGQLANRCVLYIYPQYTVQSTTTTAIWLACWSGWWRFGSGNKRGTKHKASQDEMRGTKKDACMYGVDYEDLKGTYDILFLTERYSSWPAHAKQRAPS